jgi:hypothetical protein
MATIELCNQDAQCDFGKKICTSKTKPNVLAMQYQDTEDSWEIICQAVYTQLDVLGLKTLSVRKNHYDK